MNEIPRGIRPSIGVGEVDTACHPLGIALRKRLCLAIFWVVLGLDEALIFIVVSVPYSPSAIGLAVNCLVAVSLALAGNVDKNEEAAAFGKSQWASGYKRKMENVNR